MCDILITEWNAKFGQPDINLGTILGMRGTQQLTHVIVKQHRQGTYTWASISKYSAAHKVLISK